MSDPLLDRLRADAQKLVDEMACTTPAYGAPGYEHCAACCAGTLIAATCQEDEDLARAARALVAAIDAARAGQVPA